MQPGRHSRKDRLATQHSGVWSTSSQDYINLATDLFDLSLKERGELQANFSRYLLAALPLLFSALRALLIECNSGVYGDRVRQDCLNLLARSPNELEILKCQYRVKAETLNHLELLYEVRNEIVHPAHRPTGTTDSTPEYLRPLKLLGVLETTGNSESDFVWFDQIQSHRLFRFALSTIEETVTGIVDFHRSEDPQFRNIFAITYGRYKLFEASDA